MLGLDGERLELHRRMAGVEQARQQSRDAQAEARLDFCQAEETSRLEGGSAFDLLRQLGTPMTLAEFGRRMHKLNPKFRMTPGKILRYPNTWYLEYQEPDGELRRIAAMEGPVMPEWSQLAPHYEQTMEIVDHLTDPEQGQWRAEPTGIREAVRGWRQVLLRVLDQGLVSLEAADREFGKGARRGWATHTGARSESLRF